MSFQENFRISIIQSLHKEQKQPKKKFKIIKKHKYLIGKDTDKVKWTIKLFKTKDTKRAAKVWTITTTIENIRQLNINYFDNTLFFSELYKFEGDKQVVDTKTRYFWRDWTIKDLLKHFEKLGCKIEIPKKYNYNLDFYIDSIFDCTLHSSVPFVPPKPP